MSTETSLQAELDAAGTRYALRVQESHDARYETVRAWLRWAWFGEDPVTPEEVRLATGVITVSRPLHVPSGVCLTGARSLPDLPSVTGGGRRSVIRIGPDAEPESARRRFFRDSRIGAQVATWRLRLRLLLPEHDDDAWDEDDRHDR